MNIDDFEGIRIYIYPRDHPPPHFHIIQAEHKAAMSIKDLEIIAGSLPNKTLKKVQNWAIGKQEMLLEIFNKYQ